MTTAKQHLALAIECLHQANKAQQQAFAAYPGSFETAEEDPCYTIHNSIEDVITQLEEVLDAIEQTA